MALNGGLIPFGGTFLTFSDYMRPAIRLACLSEIQVVYVFTHDSVGLGEDGPRINPSSTSRPCARYRISSLFDPRMFTKFARRGASRFCDATRRLHSR
jgi:hypothetical protein